MIWINKIGLKPNIRLKTLQQAENIKNIIESLFNTKTVYQYKVSRTSNFLLFLIDSKQTKHVRPIFWLMIDVNIIAYWKIDFGLN